MKCRHCGGRTRVIATEQRSDGAHRWLRCLVCQELTRTLETYHPRRPGPAPGQQNRCSRNAGSRNSASVLTEADVVQMRQLAAQGVSRGELARRYGLAQATVSRIVNRKTWVHV